MQGGLMAETFTICRDYKPVTVMQFYAEHVVTDPEGYRMTVIHEMKHAGFKTRHGPVLRRPARLDRRGPRPVGGRPTGVAHGLRAEQRDLRRARIPLAALNGVANPVHDLGDYLEDVLAFEWLENTEAGQREGLHRGTGRRRNWKELLAATTGLDADEALRRMDRHCRERVSAELGAGRPGGPGAAGHPDRQGSKPAPMPSRPGSGRKATAASRSGWTQHPGHVLEPVVRFYHGRGLILAGSHAEGREQLRSLIESPAAGSLRDDALFWEGYAFQQEKRMGDGARSFRVLLRDYSWSNNAAKVRGAFQPAGPER